MLGGNTARFKAADRALALINGANDWNQLAVLSGGYFRSSDVLVIEDTGNSGPEAVIDPATAEVVVANYPNINDDDVIEGGTRIEDYPFVVVDGSVPGKVDLSHWESS